MKDLRLFGTSAFPLHPSGMRGLIVCPWRAALMYLSTPSDEGGVAGDTGSATHAAVAALHRGESPARALGIMHEGLPRYPQADIQDASAMFLNYSLDTRNRNAKFAEYEGKPCIEQKIAFNLEAAQEDPTGDPIEVVGTLDQVRDIGGVLKLVDLKTSRKDPTELLYHHTLQVAAYCVGASILLQRPVQPGFLLLTRKYKSDASTSHVQWHYAWTLADTAQILQGVRHTVALIRSGKLFHSPNKDCTWCPAKSPDLCLPKLQETVTLLARA